MKIIKDFIRRIMREEVESVAEEIYQERVRRSIAYMERRVLTLVNSELNNAGYHRIQSRLNDIEYKLKIGMTTVNPQSKKED